jgi:hypothetical protein
MSKAFVKETDDEDDLPDEPLAIPAGVKNYMTPEGQANAPARPSRPLQVPLTTLYLLASIS